MDETPYMSKGISPIISAVLLLAVSLSMASIFAGWGPDLISTITDDTTNQTQSTIDCNAGAVEIESTVYNSANNETTIVVRNTGSEDLPDLEVSAWKDGLPVGDTTLDSTLEPGDFDEGTLTNTGDPDSVQANSGTCSEVRDTYEDIRVE